MKQRASVVSSFQDPHSDTPKVLLLSLRAGGVGLNLTAANRLYLLDPAWNPSTEDQCFDRIHRLGQLKNVKVTKFIMKDRYVEDPLQPLLILSHVCLFCSSIEQRIQDIRDIFGI